MKAKGSPLKDLERELVAEQPGFPVAVVGLFLGFLLGFSFKLFFSEEKIREMVERSLLGMDSRISYKVGGASFSLSNGLLPEMALVITDISLKSEERCWMRPSLEINRLKLPLDILSLLRGRIYLHEVIAGEVSLSLRSELCSGGKKDPLFEFLGAHPLRGAQPPEDRPVQGLNIDYFQVDRVHIHYLPLNFTSFELRHLQADIGPDQVFWKGVLSVNGETLSGDYSSTAFLSLEYGGTEKPNWHMKMDGSWREGRYLFLADFDPSTKALLITSDVNQIPLNQIFPLLKKYRLLSANYDGRQVWLSLKGNLQSSLADKSKPVFPRMKFDFIRLEGSIGEIEAKNMEVYQLYPFRFKPSDVEIKSLDLDALIKFLNRSHPSSILGHLGTFRGVARFENEQSVKIKGEGTGLEFIFSNQGNQQTQAMNLIGGEVEFSNGHWNFFIDRAKPVGGVFLGKIKARADHSWSKLFLEGQLDKLSFGAPIQKLMTGGGKLGSLNGNIRCLFEKNRLQNISGRFDLSETRVERMIFKSAQIAFSTKNKSFGKAEVDLNLKARGAIVEPDSPVMPYIHQVYGDTPPVSNVFIRGKTRFLKDFQWDSFQVKMGLDRLESRGKWNEDGSLDGSLKVVKQNKTSRYKIQGVRSHPILVRE